MIFALLPKFMNMIKISKSYGRLAVLIYDSIYKVVPFMVLFILWTGLFAVQYMILKSNHKDAEGYGGILTGLGFMFVAFENGIGNIINPTVDAWDNEAPGFTRTFIIYLVYFIWILN